jgi:N utilization substance protein A
LASQLTGWQIDILTEQEESERRQKEFAERTQLFMDALDVDETIAQLLASEGFASVEDVAYVPAHELADIEASTKTAKNCSRARSAISRAQCRLRCETARTWRRGRSGRTRRTQPAMLVRLGEAEIKTIEDFAGAPATIFWLHRE